MNDYVKEKIQVLIDNYARELPQKIADLERQWTKIKVNLSDLQIKDFILMSHSMAGTAGTFGYKFISSTAGKIENSLRTFQEDHDAKKLIFEIDQSMIELKQLTMHIETQRSDLSSHMNLPSSAATKKIYVLNQKDFCIKNSELPVDYQLTSFNNIESLLNAIAHTCPDMLIMNVKIAKKIPQEIIKKFQQDLITIIYMAEKDDLSMRLFNVRHGGQAFLAEPFEVNDLLRIMNNLFEAKQIRNQRILIVDDSQVLATYYAELVKQSGMIPEIISMPDQFLKTLQEFQPDLVLMDINMPFCSGTELAQIIQQQETLGGVPIIFVSSISERTQQLEVLSLAGDDFLTKPINPKYLLAAIHSRLMRSRMIRFRMMRDSLTNLYNHTIIHSQLEREVLLSKRYHKHLCVGLIDIDYFKKVNDSYGHQAGDKILKDLSLFLQKNLRSTDLIGRYGGEEFLIVLPNTNLDAAKKLLDHLQKKFASQYHLLGMQKIYIHFSGGIAAYPAYTTSKELIRAADDALYVAKQAGRDRIIARTGDNGKSKCFPGG